MTTKQKAAAYDEAIVKAREIHTETESAVTAHALEEIFPELKESEDERIRKVLINCFSGLPDSETYRGVPPSKIIAWLEKQKPAEWSKEDEKNYKKTLDFLEEELNMVRSYDEYDKAEQCLSWLKSLRPQNQWKPTEEQMETLRYYAEQPDHSRGLMLLYNDLKKL